MTPNNYFHVQRLVKDFKDAEFFTVSHYQNQFHKYLMLSFSVIAIILIIAAFANMSGTLLTWFFVLSSFALIMARFGYSLVLPVTITKGILYLFLGGKIYEKVSKIKSESRDELYTLKEAIEQMTTSEEVWRKVAEDAKSIRSYSLT